MNYRTIQSTGAGCRRGRHPHALLARGACRILDELFPGLLDELVAAGAPVLDDGDLSRLHMCYSGHLVVRSGKTTGDPQGTGTVCAKPQPFWNAMSAGACMRSTT